MQEVVQIQGGSVTWEWLVVVIFLPFTVWVIKKAWDMIAELKDSHEEHKDYSQKNYATKVDLKEVDAKHTIAGKETREYVREEVSRSEKNILREISSHKESTNKIISLLERVINKEKS